MAGVSMSFVPCSTPLVAVKVTWSVTGLIVATLDGLTTRTGQPGMAAPSGAQA